MTAQAPLDPAVLKRAAEMLRGGGLVAYPTDTVYGLAVDPTNDAAVRRLFEAKGRTPDQATPLLIASAEQLPIVATEVPAIARLLIEALWPGALTIVLPKAQTFRSIAVGDTVGVRVPDHTTPRALARMLGGPITGTSANLSGPYPEPLTAEDVRSQLGDAVDLVIDGGRCAGGRPSTVVDCTVAPPRIVREGAISREALEEKTGVSFA